MPSYQEYRAETDRLFPALARRLIIRNRTWDHKDIKSIFKDAAEQIDPELLPDLHLCAPGWREWHPDLSDPRSAHFIAFGAGGSLSGGYIQTLLPDSNGRMYMDDLAQHGIDCRYDHQMVAWLIFFHELGHARVQLRDPLFFRYAKRRGGGQGEEAACDVFAGLALTRKFGAEALPTLESWTQYRLLHASTNYQPGKEQKRYHTGPVLRAFCESLDAGRIEEIRGQGGEDFYKLARAAAFWFVRHRDSRLPGLKRPAGLHLPFG
jgi:hypothetical protein